MQPSIPDRAASRRRAVFLIVWGGVLVAFLDATIVNVAFPDLERSFAGASRSGLSWVINGYNIVFAALLVPAGAIADVLGRRRVFVIGLLVLIVASLMCAAAPSPATLVGARILQAVGAAAVIPTSLALVLAQSAAGERAVAASLWAAAAGVSAALGPPLGGLLIEAGGWRLALAAGVPIALASLVGALRVLDESREPGKPLPEPLGVLLVIGAIALLTLALLEGKSWGWDDPRTGGAVAAAALAAAAFVRRCRRHRNPVVDLTLFRDRAVSVGNLGTLLFGAAGYGIFLCNVLFLTTVWDYSSLQAGLALAPAPFAMAATARLAGGAVGRFGARAVAVPGTLVFALGAAWLVVRAGPTPDLFTTWLPGVLMTGVGSGLAYPALGSAAVVVLASESFAVGSALNAMARQIGAAIGVALVIAAIGVPTALEAPGAFDRAWILVGTLSAVALVISTRLGRACLATPAPAPPRAAAPLGPSPR
jgi:EmrB/QacA subfamily drug resistance transporter